MSSIHNVMNGILIAMVFILVAVVMFNVQTKRSMERLEQRQLFYSYNTHHNNLDTFLFVTDNESNKQMATLLSYAIYRRTNNLLVNSRTINVKEKVYDILNIIYGEGNYYLNVSPRLYDVSLNFVIDGSNSLDAERVELADKIKDIIDAANVPGRTIWANVYIISQSTARCNDFTAKFTEYALQNASCTVIDAKNNAGDLYAGPGVDTFDYRRTYDIIPPFNYIGQPNTTRPASDYYEPDWAAGVAYAINDISGTSRISIVFPMAGELSTGSINQNCYVNDFVAKGLNEYDMLICDLCNTSCDSTGTETELRSIDILDKASQFAFDGNVILNPIYAYKCNFRSLDINMSYDLQWTLWNQVYENRTGYNAGGSTICDDANCEACTSLSGDRRSVCFHSDGQNEIQIQMQKMADATGGQLSNLVDVTELQEIITSAVESNLEPFRIIMGRERPNEEQFVYEKRLPLPAGNDFVDLTLVVYKDPQKPGAPCGNGMVEIGEECEKYDTNGENCRTQGFTSGVLNCTDICTFDTNGCR